MSKLTKKIPADMHFAKASTRDQAVLSWSTHQVPGSPRMALQRQLLLMSAPVIASGIYVMLLKDALLDDPTFFTLWALIAIAHLALYLKIARQKTAYHYQIYEDHAALDHHVYYSDLEITTIKTLAAICMAVFVGAALITGSLLFLIGPAAIGFLAALRLMNSENPITHEDSLPFNEYNFVTVDRMRRIIVTHFTDPTLGFEARLPDDELFEQYLSLLRKSLRPAAEFTEKKWNSDLI